MRAYIETMDSGVCCPKCGGRLSLSIGRGLFSGITTQYSTLKSTCCGVDITDLLLPPLKRNNHVYKDQTNRGVSE